MSGSSQSNRKKRPQHTKKSKSIQRQNTTPAARAEVAPPSAVPAQKPVAVAAPRAASSKPDPTQIIYPYIAGELRTIAIFGIGLIVILIVLSFIIS